MKIDQGQFTDDGQLSFLSNSILESSNSQLILVFGTNDVLSVKGWFHLLKEKYENADIIMCSSADVIYNDQIYNNHVCFVAFEFERTSVKTTCGKFGEFNSVTEAGYELASRIPQDGLTNILVFCDGTEVNGSELIHGINKAVKEGVIITGGLASDGAQFEKTLVGLNDEPHQGTVVIVGFYGDLKIGYGSNGGWDEFGPKRLVTKSSRNKLFELDGQSALELYKKYLGEKANELPGSALLFPLAVHKEGVEQIIVRTVLDVNEEEQSMTFAGDIHEGELVQLMKANFDRLIDGAQYAADHSINQEKTEFALLISCIGRKLVLGPRIEEEIEATRHIFGNDTAIIGFYSHGEFSPLRDDINCQLHNQSMTITTFSE